MDFYSQNYSPVIAYFYRLRRGKMPSTQLYRNLDSPSIGVPEANAIFPDNIHLFPIRQAQGEIFSHQEKYAAAKVGGSKAEELG